MKPVRYIINEVISWRDDAGKRWGLEDTAEEVYARFTGFNDYCRRYITINGVRRERTPAEQAAYVPITPPDKLTKHVSYSVVAQSKQDIKDYDGFPCGTFLSLKDPYSRAEAEQMVAELTRRLKEMT